MQNKLFIAAALLAASTLPAHAQTARELMQTNSEAAYTRAQIELVKARNDLATARGVSPTQSNTPQIMSIERFGSDVIAKLRLPSGAPIEVRPNDRLPDGSVVTDIRANGVRIKKGGETTELAFMSGQQQPAASSGATAITSLPFGIK